MASSFSSSAPSSSSASGPQVLIRIYHLKGLSADVIKSFPKGRVSVSSDLSNMKAQTALATIGGSGKINEVRG